jgi:hypothetical protein
MHDLPVGPSESGIMIRLLGLGSPGPGRVPQAAHIALAQGALAWAICDKDRGHVGCVEWRLPVPLDSMGEPALAA